MRILLPSLLILVLVVAVLPGCRMNERLSGTVFGAVGGGLIGGLAGGAGGAAIGVVAGGVAGYLVGDYIADRRERGRRQVFETDTGGPPAQVMGVKESADLEPARAAYEQGRHAQTATEARSHFEESVRLDPSNPAPYNALGLNALHRGDRTEAERLFRLSLEKDPSHYAAQHNLSRLLRDAPAVAR